MSLLFVAGQQDTPTTTTTTTTTNANITTYAPATSTRSKTFTTKDGCFHFSSYCLYCCC